MIWDNFSIFRTNCTIACGTRSYMLRGFLRMSRRGISKSFILLAHNSTRLCLLEFGLSIFVVSCPSSEVRRCRSYLCSALSLTKWRSAASFTRTSHYATAKFHICKDQQLFLIQLKTSWIYLDIATSQNSKVFLLLPHACKDFGRVLRSKSKKKNNNCKFEFRLNCKQRLTFLQGPISDNRFISVVAA